MGALGQLAASPSNRIGPFAPSPEQAADIIAARRQGHSFAAIAEALTADGLPIGREALRGWLRGQGIT